MEPCIDCDHDVRKIITETVRNMVEPGWNLNIGGNAKTDVGGWIIDRVWIQEYACRWKSSLSGFGLDNVNVAYSEIREGKAN